MEKLTVPELTGSNYFIWALKMKAALSLKRLFSVIESEKPIGLEGKALSDWTTKNEDAVSYIKLSLSDEQALQYASEDNAKTLWGKLRGLFWYPRLGWELGWVPLLMCGTQPNRGYQNRPLNLTLLDMLKIGK
ncbi:hypothetical protein AVEN_9456-1 [Araneus ventricosus]|uniref:DUF4219 domain-containing protein n=1 Tax=Araneus ventricosus TaxID=182803 RepID=A0A4Y2FQN7_ARAVE|nr:hypothetical protein AVEN_9456-1 [Araneus ventricosus]